MPPQQRKRPLCHKCGLPMLGHKRNQCSSGSLPSPPVTPAKLARTRLNDPTPDSSPIATARELSFVIPDPTPLRSPTPVPLLLAVEDKGEDDEDGTGRSVTYSISDDDDGRKNHDEEHSGGPVTHSTAGSDDDDKADRESLPLDPNIELLLQLGEPIVSMYVIKREDFPRIRDAASTSAFHTTALQIPRSIVSFAGTQSASQPQSEEPDLLEDSCLLVIGWNADPAPAHDGQGKA